MSNKDLVFRLYSSREARTLTNEAAHEIKRLEARVKLLQKKLWATLKDRRDRTDQEAGDARHDLEWAMAHKLDSHLPTIEEVQAAGPYELDKGT